MDAIRKIAKQRGSTLILRCAVLALGGLVAALCIALLPALFTEDDLEFMAVLLAMYLAAIPFYIALVQTLKLLRYIDTNQAFSERSVRALRVIKGCALSIAGLYTACLPAIFYIAEQEDAPGLGMVGLIIILAATSVAVFAGVLQKLLRNAIDLKAENELTV